MAQRDIIRTEAVVLRAIEYGETSQIVTLFTRAKGLITVIAKGARRTDSKFGSSLQPMAYTQVVFYYKPTRNLQTLSESAHVESFHDLRRSLEKITLGLQMVELIYALLEEEDAHPNVFNLTVDALRTLNETTARAANVWPYFQLQLATRLGLAPSIHRDDIANLPDEGGLLALESGALLPPHAQPQSGRRASRSALRAFAIFARADLADVLRMRLNENLRREVETLIEDYMRYQFEEAYPTKSRPIIGQLLDASESGSAP
jgi:DNA repair protein RecO (recombination protein O)